MGCHHWKLTIGQKSWKKYVKITKQLCVVTEEIWQVRLRKELMKLEQ